MGKVCTLFPQFYYHGEVKNHLELKDKLLCFNWKYNFYF